jgi:hypothetical protein
LGCSANWPITYSALTATTIAEKTVVSMKHERFCAVSFACRAPAVL